MKIDADRFLGALYDGIYFRPAYVDITGGIVAALVLAQAVEWDQVARGEQWLRTPEDWRQAIRVLPRELNTALRALSKLGLLTSHVSCDTPGAVCHRLNRENLARVRA